MHFIFALSFFQRLRGLLGRSTSWLGSDAVLVIAPCNSIHTFGMKYAIDVAFLDRYGKVLLAKENFAPKKRLRCKNAACVLERPSLLSLRTQSKSVQDKKAQSKKTQANGAQGKKTQDKEIQAKKIIPWFQAGDYCELSIARQSRYG